MYQSCGRTYGVPRPSRGTRRPKRRSAGRRSTRTAPDASFRGRFAFPALSPATHGTQLALQAGRERSKPRGNESATRCSADGSPSSGLTIRVRASSGVEQLYAELDARSIAFRPAGLSERPVGLSRRHAADRRAVLPGRRSTRANRGRDAGGVENDAEAMRYMRHECGHAVNYAFELYERPEWRTHIRPFSTSVSRTLSRRSVFARVRAPHPRLVRAEASRRRLRRDVRGVADAGLDWRREYAGWPALREARVRRPRDARDRLTLAPTCRRRRDDDLPVEAMHYTVAEHYAERATNAFRSRTTDSSTRDLRGIFVAATDAPDGRAGAVVHPSALSRDRIDESRTGRARGRASCGR